MRDEGIGVRLAGILSDRCLAGVEVIDLGTGGMTLLHALEGRKRAIIMDCALMDEPAGTIRRFTVDEVRSRKKMMGRTIHEQDLIQLLDLAKQFGKCAEDVVIFGIQPEDVSQGDGLTTVLADRLDEYAGMIEEEVATAD